MFTAFFPRPRLFFASACLWTLVAVAFWYAVGPAIQSDLGLKPAGDPPIGISAFWSLGYLWFYLYFAVAVGAFSTIWMRLSPHPWARWSILGSALILFLTYFQVPSPSR